MLGLIIYIEFKTGTTRDLACDILILANLSSRGRHRIKVSSYGSNVLSYRIKINECTLCLVCRTPQNAHEIL